MSTPTATTTRGRHVSTAAPTAAQVRAEEHARTCPLGAVCITDTIRAALVRHRKRGPATVGTAAVLRALTVTVIP